MRIFISARGRLLVTSAGLSMKFGKIMGSKTATIKAYLKKYRTNIRFCSVLFLF